MGMFGAIGNGLSAVGGIVAGDQPQPKPDVFDRRRARDSGDPSIGKRLLAGLLDGILTNTGGQAVNVPLMLQQRQRGVALEDEQRKRQQELEDAIALAKAKAEFREPTALQQNFGWFHTLTPEQKAEFGSYQDMTRPLIPLDMQSEAGGPVMRSFLPQSQAAAGGAVPNIPLGSALRPVQAHKQVGDKHYYLIGNEWYDNPEGR